MLTCPIPVVLWSWTCLLIDVVFFSFFIWFAMITRPDVRYLWYPCGSVCGFCSSKQYFACHINLQLFVLNIPNFEIIIVLIYICKLSCLYSREQTYLAVFESNCHLFIFFPHAMQLCIRNANLTFAMQTLQALQERRLKFWTSKFLYILRNALKF